MSKRVPKSIEKALANSGQHKRVVDVTNVIAKKCYAYELLSKENNIEIVNTLGAIDNLVFILKNIPIEFEIRNFQADISEVEVFQSPGRTTVENIEVFGGEIVGKDIAKVGTKTWKIFTFEKLTKVNVNTVDKYCFDDGLVSEKLPNQEDNTANVILIPIEKTKLRNSVFCRWIFWEEEKKIVSVSKVKIILPAGTLVNSLSVFNDKFRYVDWSIDEIDNDYVYSTFFAHPISISNGSIVMRSEWAERPFIGRIPFWLAGKTTAGREDVVPADYQFIEAAGIPEICRGNAPWKDMKPTFGQIPQIVSGTKPENAVCAFPRSELAPDVMEVPLSYDVDDNTFKFKDESYRLQFSKMFLPYQRDKFDTLTPSQANVIWSKELLKFYKLEQVLKSNTLFSNNDEEKKYVTDNISNEINDSAVAKINYPTIPDIIEQIQKPFASSRVMTLTSKLANLKDRQQLASKLYLQNTGTNIVKGLVKVGATGVGAYLGGGAGAVAGAFIGDVLGSFFDADKFSQEQQFAYDSAMLEQKNTLKTTSITDGIRDMYSLRNANASSLADYFWIGNNLIWQGKINKTDGLPTDINTGTKVIDEFSYTYGKDKMLELDKVGITKETIYSKNITNYIKDLASTYLSLEDFTALAKRFGLIPAGWWTERGGIEIKAIYRWIVDNRGKQITALELLALGEDGYDILVSDIHNCDINGKAQYKLKMKLIYKPLDDYYILHLFSEIESGFENSIEDIYGKWYTAMLMKELNGKINVSYSEIPPALIDDLGKFYILCKDGFDYTKWKSLLQNTNKYDKNQTIIKDTNKFEPYSFTIKNKDGDTSKLVTFKTIFGYESDTFEKNDTFIEYTIMFENEDNPLILKIPLKNANEVNQLYTNTRVHLFGIPVIKPEDRLLKSKG